MGLNSLSPSLPLPQSRSVKQKGGGGYMVDSDGWSRDNRMMIFDHSLKGYPGLENCQLNVI